MQVSERLHQTPFNYTLEKIKDTVGIGGFQKSLVRERDLSDNFYSKVIATAAGVVQLGGPFTHRSVEEFLDKKIKLFHPLILLLVDVGMVGAVVGLAFIDLPAAVAMKVTYNAGISIASDAITSRRLQKSV